MFLMAAGCNPSQTNNQGTNPPPAPQQSPTPSPQGTQTISETEAKRLIENISNQVFSAIKNKDIAKLASFVHPGKGIIFSPYASVSEKNVLLKSSDVVPAYSGNKIYLWGYTDGKGDPMNYTFKEYFDKFVYSDFSKFTQTGYNKILGGGNSTNNAFDYFPNAIIVEYYNPGTDSKYEGMDWESLRLVFQEKDGVWFLVGVIRDEWTI